MHDPLVVAFEIPRPWPSYFHIKAGRRRYWPAMVTVWHREPGGHDSGEVCKHYRREQRPDGTWKATTLRSWKWHVHHWRIQVPALQELRRRLLTRCAWCGGRSRKGDAVNVSHSWDGPRSRWWQGERGLYHRDCSAVTGAHAGCLCADPVTDHEGYGRCARCGRYRAWGKEPGEAERLLASIPKGQRIPVDMRPNLDAIWHSRLRERGIDPQSTVSMWPK